MSSFDRIPERLSEQSRQRRRQKQDRVSGEFLKGPIPLTWLERAARLPGKALAVGLAIWFRAGLESSQLGLKLRRRTLERLEVSRKAGYRAINALEQEGLIRVERQDGCRPLIDIVDVWSTSEL